MTKPTVLLIEDHKGIRDSIIEILESEDLNVITASSSRNAFKLLSKGPLPYWILLDLTLPHESGIDIVGAIKKDARYKNIPITLLSASSQIKMIAESLNIDFIEKPFEMSELITKSKIHLSK